MKQKLLFLALMAVSSQTLLSHYRHGGYWGGGLGFGYYGPGYGYYGPGYYPGYYSPINAVADIAGAAITASAIQSAHEEAREYSRKRMRDEDFNKGRRSELAGEIYDAEKDLSALQKKNASTSEIAAKKEEIASLNKQLNKLR